MHYLFLGFHGGRPHAFGVMDDITVQLADLALLGHLTRQGAVLADLHHGVIAGHALS